MKRSFSIPGLGRLTNFLRVNTSFRAEFRRFQDMSARSARRFELRWRDRWPWFMDRTETARFDPHYVYHTGWAARKLAELRPAGHVDISSSLHFCTTMSAFIPMKFCDLRPVDVKLKGLDCGRADLLKLPFADNSQASLSCMHVIEHVGLGRYGDPLDAEGDIKAASELRRVLAPGGSLLMVAPIGRPKIEFNAHRIYSYAQIMELFRGLELVEFALLPDDASNGLVVCASEAQADAQTCGCGCFWFRKSA